MNKTTIQIILVLSGAGIGCLYYRFFGCTNGCPIISNPVLIMIYGGIIGWLISNVIY